jgi:hypothetical protein
MTVPTAIIDWLRTNPLPGRLFVKLAVVLPLGLLAGVLLSELADWLGWPQNVAAIGAAMVALGAGLRLANRVADQLRIPEP